MSNQPSSENCECGQYHIPTQDEIQEDTTSMEEKLEALNPTCIQCNQTGHSMCNKD